VDLHTRACTQVVWEGKAFFDGYRPFERVHTGGANVLSSTIEGLRAENTVLCRVRAKGYAGHSEWNTTAHTVHATRTAFSARTRTAICIHSVRTRTAFTGHSSH
jgi:hypothetical protein